VVGDERQRKRDELEFVEEKNNRRCTFFGGRGESMHF